MLEDEHLQNANNLDYSEIRFFISQNWPKRFPLFYFNLHEVPYQHQKFVQETFVDSIFQGLTYIINWIVCFLCRRDSAMNESRDPIFIISSFNLFILFPIVFSFFHFEIYQILLFNLTRDSILSILLITFIILFLDFFSLMGNESTGTCGICFFISLALDKMYFRSFLSLFVFILFCITFILHFKFLMRIVYFIKGRNIPFSQFEKITEQAYTFLISHT